MLYELRCGHTAAKIDTLGAQLRSLTWRGEEYLWQGSPETWSQTAPVLFPVVGRCKDDQIEIGGKFYPMPQHGFAQNMEFRSGRHTACAIELILENNTETKAMYPYDFLFVVAYTLTEKGLNVYFSVKNTGNRTLYYGLGGHPGFRCPMDGENITDWQLVFAREEPLLSIPVTPAGAIADVWTGGQKTAIPHSHGAVSLTRDFFAIDALIFENIRSQSVALQSRISGKGVRMRFSGFSMIAFWTLPHPDAKFLCIEPWQGIAHIENAGYALSRKKGIVPLAPCHTDTKNFSIEIL